MKEASKNFFSLFSDSVQNSRFLVEITGKPAGMNKGRTNETLFERNEK
jgi:hypothetical protein